MSLNTPEFEPRNDEENEGTPLDGRDGQPVEEGSSDDPRTLDTMDPLRDEQREVDALNGNEARAEDARPLKEEGRTAEQEDAEIPAGARVEEPTDAAGQEAGGLDALGRPLPPDAPEEEQF
ncbi:hypothetical protein ACIPVK_18685 [Paeniglutamicibacter sp. MACA_103]|uniref:hypothetical protein n=1 Tax=Paeniglutamicibacter sp. MACA_103 TaxID=3377337 RepID=UPI003895F4F8